MRSIEKRVLIKALRRFDKLRKDADQGIRPLNRPKEYQKIERMKDKRMKKETWATNDGCIAPIIIPPTPNSELLNS